LNIKTKRLVNVRVCGWKSKPVAGERIHVSSLQKRGLWAWRGLGVRPAGFTERGSSESDPFANPPAGECGVKDQVRRTFSGLFMNFLWHMRIMQRRTLKFQCWH